MDVTSSWQEIVSVRYERTDFFYDLHVPGPEHYLADGIWSHNTGKTRACLEYINFLCSNYRLRVLILRQTLQSLRESVQITYEHKGVVHEGHPVEPAVGRQQCIDPAGNRQLAVALGQYPHGAMDRYQGA